MFTLHYVGDSLTGDEPLPGFWHHTNWLEIAKVQHHIAAVGATLDYVNDVAGEVADAGNIGTCWFSIDEDLCLSVDGESLTYWFILTS